MKLLQTLVLCSAILCQPVHAWNGFGHMVIAYAAYEQLTPTARTKVNALLQLNPRYPDWINGIPRSDRDEIAFMKAATWPDYIKHTKDYQDDGSEPDGSDVSRNIGYEDKYMHRYWHYIDLPFSSDGTALIQPLTPNALTLITAFRATLSSPDASNGLKSYDLVWLIHLVGDVHQPLHTTSRITHRSPYGDHGGNQDALCYMPCRRELHAYWDGVLGTSNKPLKARTFARHLPSVGQHSAKIGNEAEWVRESFAIAKESVYVNPIGSGLGPYQLSPEYRANAQRVAKDRAAVAGARLAQLINSALD